MDPMATVCTLSVCSLEMHLHKFNAPARFQIAVQMRCTALLCKKYILLTIDLLSN
jgi:hypothetical protein